MAKHLIWLVSLFLVGQLHQLQAKEKKLMLHKIEKINENEHDFKSELRIGERNEEGHLLISGELKQHVTIDEDWELHIAIHRADTRDEPLSEFLRLPHLSVCDFMKTYYKEFLYEKLREYSNAPHPDTCPLPPEHYHLKDYPLNADHLRKYLIPGYYHIASKLMNNDETKLEYLVVLQVE